MGKLVFFSHSDFVSIQNKEEKKKIQESKSTCFAWKAVLQLVSARPGKNTGTKPLKMWHTLTQTSLKRMPKTEHTIKSFFCRQAEQRDFLCQWTTYNLLFSAVGVRIRKVVYYSTISPKARKTLFIRNFKSLCHRYQVYILYTFAKSN